MTPCEPGSVGPTRGRWRSGRIPASGVKLTGATASAITLLSSGEVAERPKALAC